MPPLAGEPYGDIRYPSQAQVDSFSARVLVEQPVRIAIDRKGAGFQKRQDASRCRAGLLDDDRLERCCLDAILPQFGSSCPGDAEAGQLGQRIGFCSLGVGARSASGVAGSTSKIDREGKTISAQKTIQGAQ